MTGLSWIDLFLRLIPEGLIFILAGYAVSKKVFNVKTYLLSSVIFALAIFTSKMLPIGGALSMILSATIAVLLLVFINKIKVIHAIISTIACLLLTILIEVTTIFALEKVFHIDPIIIFQNENPFLKNMYGMPSLLLFAAIVLAYYFLSRRKTNNETTR